MVSGLVENLLINHLIIRWAKVSKNIVDYMVDGRMEVRIGYRRMCPM